MLSSHFFLDSRSKEHHKYRCFLLLGSPKPPYLRCFLALVAKITVLPSKNTGIYAVLSMLQEVPFPCQRQYKLQCFGSWHAPKNQRKPVKKCPTLTFQTLLSTKPRFYPCSAAQERENTTRVKGFAITSAPCWPQRLRA